MMRRLSSKTVSKAKQILKIERKIRNEEVSVADGQALITQITATIPIEELMDLDEYIYSKLNRKSV